MLKRTIAIGAALLLSTAGLYAQRGNMSGEAADTIPGMRGHGMMMKGAMGHGMMGHGMMGCPMMGEGMMGEGMMGEGMMGEGMRGGGMMMGPGMGMMGMGASPAMVLSRRDALGLTDDQVGRLEELRDELSAEMEGHMTAAMAVRRNATEALGEEEADFGAYEEALQEAASNMVQAHVAMARTARQTRDVLTPEQWEQVQERGMMHRPGMMHGPGTEGGPGMMGGSGHGSGGIM